jgi:hypothetical protein
MAKEKKEEVSKDIKYRCDFKTWKEFNSYKGPKG